MRHSDCGTRAVQKQLPGPKLGCTLNRQHDIASGLPSHHNIAIAAGTEAHMQYRIVKCNPAIRRSDCDNRATTQDVQLRLIGMP